MAGRIIKTLILASNAINMPQIPTPEDLHDIGLKATGPRMKILDFFHQNGGTHFSAEDVFMALAKEDKEIGLATVYRVLTQFERAGLLLRSHFESTKWDSRAIYELNEGQHHDHLVCIDCGHVEEFVDEAIEKRQRDIAKNLGFQLHEHALAMYGHCQKKNCFNKQAKKRPLNEVFFT
ncbi:MAG TPA: ferric iron uptake transcriptional regulator [Polynucleobacter sp.]|nr:ferric iron uptake transcriptional regulator [Polynucleobacter sp.]